MFQKLLRRLQDRPSIQSGMLAARWPRRKRPSSRLPATPGNQIEFKGKVPKVVEYLDQLAEAAAPDTPWATDSKKLADALRTNEGEFVRVQRTLSTTDQSVRN